MEVTKTYMAKPGELQPKWWLVDATDKVVGRLASEIAMILMGKHRPTYTPHVDTGDFVVVVNAEKVVFSDPDKWEQKQYTWYTGYPGLKTETAAKRKARRPELILREAVRRMLPKNKLAFKMLNKLKIYAGGQHPHQAQQPEPKELGVKKCAPGRNSPRNKELHGSSHHQSSLRRRRHPGHRTAQDLGRPRADSPRPGANHHQPAPLDEYFHNVQQRNAVLATLVQTGKREQVDVVVRVEGGGITGQADAIKLGLARAMKKFSQEVEGGAARFGPADARQPHEGAEEVRAPRCAARHAVLQALISLPPRSKILGGHRPPQSLRMVREATACGSLNAPIAGNAEFLPCARCGWVQPCQRHAPPAARR